MNIGKQSWNVISMHVLFATAECIGYAHGVMDFGEMLKAEKL